MRCFFWRAAVFALLQCKLLEDLEIFFVCWLANSEAIRVTASPFPIYELGSSTCFTFTSNSWLVKGFWR